MTEKQTDVLRLMVRMYCRSHHKQKKGLCDECQELFDYAVYRKSKCPFKDQKSFCNTCPIHCYKPAMREKMRNVMKYSGPRLLFIHPILALAHMYLTIKWVIGKKKKARAKAKADKKAAKATKKAEITEATTSTTKEEKTDV